MDLALESTATVAPERLFRADAPRTRLVIDEQAQATDYLTLFEMTDVGGTQMEPAKQIEAAQVVMISALVTKRLRVPLSVLLERDGDQFLAQTVDFPLYSLSDTRQGAVEGLQHEIESLYNDLMVDDQFSPEWLNRKKLLSAIVTV